MSLELGRGVMTGTWRAKLYADPKGEPISQVSFLVEDFVPERIDLTLTPESKSIAIEERAAIAATGKYLLWAASAEPGTRRRHRSAPRQGAGGICGLQVRPRG